MVRQPHCAGGAAYPFASPSAFAATTYTWSQTAGGAQNWTTTANWNPNASPSPVSGDTVDFSTINIAADTTLTLGADRTATTWKFGDTSGTQNWIVNAGNKIILAGTTPTISVLQNTATLNNVVDGAVALTKSGAGTLTLTAANTYSGGTTIAASSGVVNALRISNNTALGSGTLTIGSGGNSDQARLELTGGITVGNTLAAWASRAAGSTAPNILNVSGNNTISKAISAGSGGNTCTLQSDAGKLTLASTVSVRLLLLAGNGDGEIQGAVTVTTGNGLQKTGNGTWTINAGAVADVPITVGAGKLMVNGTLTGTSAGTLTVSNGATLGGSGTIPGTVNVLAGGYLAPGGVGTYGTLTLASGVASALTLNGNLLQFDLNTATTAGTTYDQIAISSTGNLVLNGSNILQLNAPSGTIHAGTYTLMTYAATTGSGTLTLPNGALTMGNFALTVGATSVTLAVSADTAYTALTWKGYVSASWDGTDLNWTNGAAASTFSAGNAVTFDDSGPGASTITSAATVLPGSVLFNNNATNYTISATIGSGNIVKYGSASATISGAYTNSGPVAVNGGTLYFTGGFSGITSGTVASGATLQFLAPSTTLSVFPLFLNGNGSINTLDFPSGNSKTYNIADIGLSGNVIIHSYGLINNYNFNSPITNSGANSLKFQTDGGNTASQPHTITLGAASSYSGNTTLAAVSQQGILKLGVNNALPATTTLTLTGGGNANTSASLELNGKSQLISGLITTPNTGGAKVINSSGTAATLTVSNASANAVSGVLGGGGSGNNYTLTKQNSGTLTLNAVNTYAGNTTIGAGTLALGASSSIAKTPQIAISSNATFDVSANTSGFTFTGSSPVQTLAASSTAGTATITAGTGTAGVTLASGALLSFQADGTSSNVCKISVTGDLNLNANAITVNVNGAALAAGDYTLMSCSGTLANTGTFGTPSITGTPLSGTIPSIVVSPGALGTIVLRIANPAAVDTSIALTRTAGGSPSIYGDSLTFHAVLTANDASTIPDGQTITFLTNGVVIGTSLTSGGAANLTTNSFSYSGGSAFPVTATFGGISGYNSCVGTLSGGQQVNKYTLTISGATAQNKLVDGGTAAVITGGTLSSTLFSDVVTATNGTFASPAAGSGISVTVSLSGPAAANYTLTQPGLTATIFANPTWTNTASGYWDTNANWISSTVANGSGVAADFSQINPTADVTVSLKSARTIGNLIFSDTDNTSAAGWTLDNGGTSANILTLAGGTPTITVSNLAAGKTAMVSAAITSAANVVKAGTGTLVLGGTTSLGTALLNVSAGTLVLTNGGVVTCGNSTSQGVAGGATLVIDGGSLSPSGYFSVANSAGTGTFTLNSGAFTNTSEFLICYSGTTGVVNINGGVADLNNFSMANAGGQTSTMNLNSGGTVRLNFFNARNAAATANINFNGATVVAKSSQGNFIGTNSILTANVQVGGAIFDSNGNSITNNAPLQHDPALGATPDGGLTKKGSGSLTLSAVNAYTGNTTINAGTLALSGTGSIGNSAVISVTNGATFNVLPGGFTVGSGKMLRGAGTVGVGAVSVASGGTLAPGDNGIGTLTLAAAPTLGGTLAMEIKQTDLTADKLNLTSGVFTYGGTLALTNTAGTLSGGEVFDLFDFTGTSSGFFTTITTTPALASGLNWYLGNLAANGTIVLNRAPVASDIPMGALSGTPVTLQIIDGKYAPTDADGNSLIVSTVQSPSANSGTVTTDGTNVTYTADNNFTGTDTFTYTVSDGFGGITTNLVTATVAANGAGFNLLSGPVNHGDGSATINYAGIPGYHYALETTTNLTTLPILWTALVTNTASTTNGQLSFTFSTAAGQGFFRTRYVP